MTLFRRLRLLFTKADARESAENPDAFLANSRYIIHLGANTGQERQRYRDLGLHVLWIEAHPLYFEQLKRNIARIRKQIAVNALVSNVSGEKRTFYVSNNDGLSSSIFTLAKHKEIWPEVDYSDKIELETRTLDELVSQNVPPHWRVDTLIMDIQGAELLALRGATHLLKTLTFVKAEAADFEAYEGACTVASLSEFLETNGFTPIRKTQFAGKEGVGSYFDVVWMRRPVPKPTR